MLRKDFDKLLLIKFCAVWAFFFILGYFTVFSFYLVIIISLILAVFGGAYSLMALSLYTLLKCLNPGIYHFPAEYSMIAWLVLIISSARNIISIRSSAQKILVPLLIFSLITALLSAISSSHLSVSLMKILSFVIGVCGVVAAYSTCSKKDLTKLQHWLISAYIIIILFSGLTIAQPQYGYLVNGVGFQGILNQPQTFGALLSPLLAWLLVAIGFGRVKIISVYTLFAILVLALIVMSQARTALVSVFLSIVTLFLIFILNQSKFKMWGSIKKISINIAVFAIALVILFSFSTGLRETANDFVYKRGSTNIEKAVSSRSNGYEMQLQNFREKPLLGHGFGVYPGEKSTKGITTFMGIPISAPVEKGFILTALLEETGIIGTLLFFALIVSMSKICLKSHNLGWVAVFFSCLYVNTGEALFFAVGGIGLFYWILIGMSLYEYKLNISKSKLPSGANITVETLSSNELLIKRT